MPHRKLNYPVMYTPEKYLHLSFEETYSVSGVPFLDGACSLDPESDNLIIYGHNMINGTRFRTLISYDQKNYWEAYPNICFLPFTKSAPAHTMLTTDDLLSWQERKRLKQLRAI